MILSCQRNYVPVNFSDIGHEVVEGGTNNTEKTETAAAPKCGSCYGTGKELSA